MGLIGLMGLMGHIGLISLVCPISMRGLGESHRGRKRVEDEHDKDTDYPPPLELLIASTRS
jgi:hypothetical protein